MSVHIVVESIGEAMAKAQERRAAHRWIWDGYLGQGKITILTSLWKAGKTTLLAELFRSMRSGEPLFGRAVKPAKVIVFTEEDMVQWTNRHKLRPFAESVHFARCLPGQRFTMNDWHDFLKPLEDHPPDLLVVDPLIQFAPPHCEVDSQRAIDFLSQFRFFAGTIGFAVLLLHHPGKSLARETGGPRGVGVLASTADILLEYRRYSKLKRDEFRRTLAARSRFAETQSTVSVEWNPASGRYAVLEASETQSLWDGIAALRTILRAHPDGLTRPQLLDHWPDDAGRPSRTTAYHWLNAALREGTVETLGNGKRGQPVTYRAVAKVPEVVGKAGEEFLVRLSG